VGNGTTTPGGAVYTAARYQIAHLGYRVQNNGFKVGKRDMPLFVDLQVARNVGTRELRDAIMGSLNLGEVHEFGDVRFLYQYAIKDANSVIAQFTDDDLGTGVTTNIAVHAVRFDLGLTKALQWQNLLFIRTSDVPVTRRCNSSCPCPEVQAPRFAIWASWRSPSKRATAVDLQRCIGPLYRCSRAGTTSSRIGCTRCR